MNEHQSALKAIRDLDTLDMDKRKAILLMKAIARAALKVLEHPRVRVYPEGALGILPGKEPPWGANRREPRQPRPEGVYSAIPMPKAERLEVQMPPLGSPEALPVQEPYPGWMRYPGALRIRGSEDPVPQLHA